MKRVSATLKVAAVVSSAVLVAGLVSYRAGAFGWIGPTGTPSVEPAPDQNPPDATARPPADGVTSGVVISGSKSGIFVVPPGQTAASPAPGGSTVVMPGSKSITPVIPPNPAPQPSAPPK